MKTVFQRAISVIMCVILVVCTMSTMAFAATDFTYDRFMDKTEKSLDMNIKPVLDMVEDVLKKQNIYEKVVIYEGGVLLDEISFVVDLTSIDKICETLDNYRGIIKLASNDTIAALFNLGDIKDVDLSTFDEGLKRSKDGDVKILEEFLSLANANGTVISKLIDGTLDLGIIGSALGVDFSTIFGKDGVSGLITGLLVGIVYDKGTSAYNSAYNSALTDLDSFIYGDLVNNFLPNADGIISADSTVNDLLVNAFAYVIKEYVAPFFENFNEDLNNYKDKVDFDITKLADILVLDGDQYNFEDVKFEKGTPILDQVNDVLGIVFTQLVPDFDWTEGGYNNIAGNMEGLFEYVAVESGLIEGAEDMTFDQHVVSILQLVCSIIDFGSVEKYTEGIEDCVTVEDVVTRILANVANYGMGIDADYSKADYEVILGDIYIDFAGSHFLIADPAKDVCEVGEGYTIWDVLNYSLNYFLVDKNFNSLLGKCTKNISKNSTLFEKLDLICDMFAADGRTGTNDTNRFSSEAVITDAIECAFNLDIQGLIECTVKRASDYVNNTLDDPSAVQFLYEAVYNYVKNFADGKEVFPKYQSNKPFTKAVSAEGLSGAVKALLGALNGRSKAVASVLGLFLGLDSVSVSVDNIAPVVYTGSTLNPSVVVYGNSKRLENNVDYTYSLTSSEVGDSTVVIKGIGAYDGEIYAPVKVVLANVSGLKATPASASSVALSWNKVAGASSYSIYNGSSLVKSGITANSYTVTGLSAGTQYNFRVVAVNGNTTSEASVKTATQPAQVTGLAASTPTNTSVKLTWAAAKGAAGYYVQSDATGSWKTVATVAANNATVTVAANSSASYKVIAYSTDAAGTKYSGAASAVVSARTAPNAPSGFAVKSVGATTVTLSWNAVAGVTGYEIYDGSGKLVGTTTGTSYTVSGLSAKTAYKYKVRAYTTANGKNYCSAYTSTVSVTTLLAAPTNLKVKSTTGTSIKISWKKVTGAKKYQVYYSTNGKKWKRATTSKKNSATIMDLKANTTYQIRVRVYNSSSVYGDYTEILTTSTAPSKGTLKKVTAGKKKMTVTWKKVAGVTGYEVQYSTSSRFKKAKTVNIKKAKTVKKDIKKLKKGTKYYVRVRAYKTVEGKKIYGKYSEYKTVTVK